MAVEDELKQARLAPRRRRSRTARGGEAPRPGRAAIATAAWPAGAAAPGVAGAGGAAQGLAGAARRRRLRPAHGTGQPALDASEREWEERLESLAARIQRLGPINLAAIEEYQQQSERKRYLDSQNDDLAEALETLENVIRKIDRETRNRFKETFDQINAGLQALFPKVFGGGTAYLELTGEDLLDTGVAIMARPPGKKNSTIHLLSGGGKGADRAGAGIRHLPVEPGAVLHARRSRCAIGRCQRRTLCAIGEGDVGKGAVHLYHPQQDRHGNGRSVDGRDHAWPGCSRLVAVDVEEAVALAEA